LYRGCRVEPLIAVGRQRAAREANMSQILSGILAAFALSATFGAVQFASGRDLNTAQQNAAKDDTVKVDVAVINRNAKSDRASAIQASPGQDRTISLQLNGLSDTSVLIRLPLEYARNEVRGRFSPLAPKAPVTVQKSTLACEPVVSVLTDVAKVLQPGRCVT
jgi:hypothetical protein